MDRGRREEEGKKLLVYTPTTVPAAEAAGAPEERVPVGTLARTRTCTVARIMQRGVVVKYE